MQYQQQNYEIDNEQAVKEPYYFYPSITKRKTVCGKKYIVKSYFIGGKDFSETVKRLATGQAQKNER